MTKPNLRVICGVSGLLSSLAIVLAAGLQPAAVLTAADGGGDAPTITLPTPAPEPGPVPTTAPTTAPAPATEPAPAAGTAATSTGGLSDDDYDLLKSASDDLGENDEGKVEKAKRRCTELAPSRKAAILASLRDTNKLKKLLALRLLPYIGDDPTAAKAAGAVLDGPAKDDDDHVRLLAAMALYNQPDPAGIAAAMDAVLTDADKKVRAAAAQALGRFNDERAVAPLIKALDDSYAQVRGNAASSLARLKLDKDKVLDKLLNALDTEQDLTVKARIQGAIATLQDRADTKPEGEGKEKNPLDVLNDLAEQMGTIQDKLRAEDTQIARNAQVVDQQENVVENLDQLIKKLEEQQSSSSSSSKSKSQGKKKKQGEGEGKGEGQGQGKKGGGKTGGHSQEGAKESTLSPDSVQYGEQGALTGEASASFAKLPDAERETLQNLRGKEVPEQWINVLQSYWMSVNKIEAKEGAEQDHDQK